MDSGAQVDIKDGFGMTALMFASKNGYFEISKLLLDHGAQVDTKDNNTGKTALINASEYGRLSVLKLLLDFGAEVDIKDNNGMTALMYASKSRNIDILKLLYSLFQIPFFRVSSVSKSGLC